jgi:hypothetical protein
MIDIYSFLNVDYLLDKPPIKAICKSYIKEGLTINKQYDIVGEDEDNYFIYNDRNELYMYHKEGIQPLPLN